MFNSAEKALAIVLFAATLSTAGAAETSHYGLGQTPTKAQIESWAIAVRPDGQGLPDGKGSVSDGDQVFSDNCAACHGTFGEGSGRFPRIAGEGSLTGDRPEQTVRSYWPYATTLFDYINRAMPFPSPHTLPPDQVYAVTAYVLNLNGLVDDNFVADKETLPKVKMPNRDGFIWKDPRPDTHDTACIKDCRKPGDIKIVSTAEGKPLTPKTTGPLDTEMPQ